MIPGAGGLHGLSVPGFRVERKGGAGRSEREGLLTAVRCQKEGFERGAGSALVRSNLNLVTPYDLSLSGINYLKSSETY